MHDSNSKLHDVPYCCPICALLISSLLTGPLGHVVYHVVSRGLNGGMWLVGGVARAVFLCFSVKVDDSFSISNVARPSLLAWGLFLIWFIFLRQLLLVFTFHTFSISIHLPFIVLTYIIYWNHGHCLAFNFPNLRCSFLLDVQVWWIVARFHLLQFA